MRLLLLHLSDLHIQQRQHIDIDRIEKMINALNVFGEFDECMIICTGDLASSGNENEYKKVNFFIGSLISKLKEKVNNKYINYFFVPGNHDISFNDSNRSSNEVQSFYDNETIDEHLDNEFVLMNNFFKYAERNGCYRYDKICERRFVHFGDYVIQVNLINTAPFSSLEKDDKLIHYFPSEKLQLLNKHDKADISITLMHHSPEWFQWECKKNLNSAIRRGTSILFVGHDHLLTTLDINIEYSNLIVSCGGIYHKDIVSESEFNTILLDTETQCIDSYEFKWNKKESIFCSKQILKEKNIGKNKELIPNADFIRNLKEDEKRKVTKDFTQYYIFPTITGKKDDRYSDEKEIEDLEDFINEIEEKKHVHIIGHENSGKTTLLKALYLYYSNEKVPIFFSIEDLKNKRMDRIIKYAFENQYYEEPVFFEKYKQLDKNYKIAIIDDFDSIKTEKVQKDLINYFKTNFAYIILTTKPYNEFNILDSIKNELTSENLFTEFKIKHFYLKKRQDLIKSVCQITQPMNEEETNVVVNTINNLVRSNFQFFNLDPDFIIQFTQYFLKDYQVQNTKNEFIFSKIFETNIYNSIIQYSKSHLVDITITALEEIAYYVHFNKKDPLPFKELEEVIDKYNFDYSEKLNSREIVDVACKARIFKNDMDSNSLSFCNKNYLAFFVAKSLNRKYMIDNSISDIEYIMRNICFGINSTIILFVSYLASNPKIIMAIHRAAESLMRDWDEFNLDVKNISFLSNINETEEITIDKDDRKKNDDFENRQEEEEEKNKEIVECTNLYDYDEGLVDNLEYRLLRAYKYTDILSKALPSFHNILLKENKMKLLDSIYKYPNKIIYQILKPIDDNFTEYVKEIKQFVDKNNLKNKKGEVYKESDIEVLFLRFGITAILTIYDNFAFNATDKRSISILESYDLSNLNYKIFNLLIAENYGKTEELTRKAENIYDNTKDRNVKRMISLIIRKHLIYNDNIKFSKRQQLVDKFLGKDARKSLLIESKKERKM